MNISSGVHLANQSEEKFNIGKATAPTKPPKQRQNLKIRRTLPFNCQYNTDSPCCNRGCHAIFNCELIDTYRATVNKHHKDIHRQRIKEYHEENLLVDGKPCCIDFLLNCFDISKSWLYPSHNPTDRVEKCPKSISILAWFESLKESADIMPDAQIEVRVHDPVAAYQIPHLKKNEVFKEYISDCKLFPGLYSECDESYFYKQWRNFYPNVKLRKYLKFAKCEVCVNCREIKKDPTSTAAQKQAACVKQTNHLTWVKKERAGELARQQRAVYCPKDVLTITQDATDFPFVAGIPSLMDKTKTDGEVRIKPTIMVTLSHGDGVFVWPALPHIAKDPNFTIECIQRTLKHVESSRGTLPPKLHIQLDNSGRENRNTALFAYLSWLVQRDVFKVIEVHFLPKGHTHNIADQVNSRVTTSTKHANIKSREDLCEVLEHCYDPNPRVEFIDRVASIKKLFNPTLNPQWSGSRVYRLHGIQSRDQNAGNKMMHFQITKDAKDIVQIRHKTKCDVEEFWSEPFQIFKDTPPVFNLDDIGSCVTKQLPDDIIEKMKAGVDSCKQRIPTQHYDSCIRDIETMRLREPVDFHWEDGGRFNSEKNLPPATAIPQINHDITLRVAPPNRLAINYNQLQQARQGRVHCSIQLCISHFIAVKIIWEGSEDKRQDFWVGKLASIDKEQQTVKYWYWSSPSQFGTYKAWRGGGNMGTARIEDIILCAPDLLESNGKINKQCKITINHKLDNESPVGGRGRGRGRGVGVRGRGRDGKGRGKGRGSGVVIQSKNSNNKRPRASSSRTSSSRSSSSSSRSSSCRA